MHAHTPPFTKPRHASDASKLYDETSKIAAAQDAKLDPISDVEAKVRTALSHLHHAQLLLKEVFPEPRARAPKWSPDCLVEQGTPATSPYLASFSPNEFQAESLLDIGIGDVEQVKPEMPADIAFAFILLDGIERHPNNQPSKHPMHAEALRVEDERTPEDRL